MADLTLKALLDATDAVLGDDGGKHRLDDKARKVVRERDELRDALKSNRVWAGAAGGGLRTWCAGGAS